MAIDTNELVEGDIYQVEHRRKGTFTVKLVKAGRDWLDCNLVEGDPQFMLDRNTVEPGQPMTLRVDLIDRMTRVTP